MTCRILDWDSSFYGFRIGEIKSNEDDIGKCLDKLYKNKTKLIYVFSKIEIQNIVLLENYNGDLIDTKLIFEKYLEDDYNRNVDNIYEFEGELPSKELYGLTLLSGHKSRFKKDKQFPKGSFEKLYRLWIEKSIEGLLSDKVFVYIEENKILGFITVKIKNQIGEIGLIAVAKNSQGKKIGQKLISKVESYILSSNVNVLRVATQNDNLSAIKFYNKNMFYLVDSIFTYHLWIKHS